VVLEKILGKFLLEKNEKGQQFLSFITLHSLRSFSVLRDRMTKKHAITDIARTKLHPGARPKALGR